METLYLHVGRYQIAIVENANAIHKCVECVQMTNRIGISNDPTCGLAKFQVDIISRLIPRLQNDVYPYIDSQEAVTLSFQSLFTYFRQRE